MRARLLLVALLTLTVPLEAKAQSKIVILSTTTCTQDSGLLDVLVPMFEGKTGYTVKTISVGTGQALALAARGEADVTLAHAPALEKQYVTEGKMQNGRLVMPNVTQTRSFGFMTRWILSKRRPGSQPGSMPRAYGLSSSA
jgi:tungstate transport system substrate-binding protein